MSVESKNNFFPKYAEASFYGATRALFGLPFEHPFDCVKTRWQADPCSPSAASVARAVYKQNGFRGFYKGAMPNGTRVAIKQVYRWPLMFMLPPFFHHHLPSSFQGATKEKVYAGVTLATADTYVMTPLERLKVWRMTSSTTTQGWRPFFSNTSIPLTSSLFKGLRAVWVRGMCSWVTFLATDQSTKDALRPYYPNGQLSYGALFGCSLVVGGVNTVVVQPFDAVKTHQQKENPLAFKSVIKTMRHIRCTYGIRGLYAGWSVKIVQYTVQSLFTVSLMEKLENKWKKSAH